jgi:hypothetical protein
MQHSPIHRNLHYAIQNNLMVEFNYAGEGIRIAEPFCLGRSTQGNVILRAFQLRGHSNSETPEWKLFDLAKISELKVRSESFVPTDRENYHVGDKAMDTIFIQVYY